MKLKAFHVRNKISSRGSELSETFLVPCKIYHTIICLKISRKIPITITNAIFLRDNGILTLLSMTVIDLFYIE